MHHNLLPDKFGGSLSCFLISESLCELAVFQYQEWSEVGSLLSSRQIYGQEAPESGNLSEAEEIILLPF